MFDSPSSPLVPLLARIAEALERLAPPVPLASQLEDADAFVWQAEHSWLEPVPEVSRIDLPLLKGINEQRDRLLANTRRFASGDYANNALLWGARGTGKSSLVKAVHATVNKEMACQGGLALIEIQREDIHSLPQLLKLLRGGNRLCILFCDDLSFDMNDDSYKYLKVILDGGLQGRPRNVVFYATSNRRHLLSRSMIENEQSSAIHPRETADEKISLSDRFGLWIGFHNMNQDTYFEIVRSYAHFFGLRGDETRLLAAASEWSVMRGARSGRVAWQFILDYAEQSGTSPDKKA